MILRTKDIINIRSVDGNMALTYNNDLIFCFKISLPEVYSLSEVDYDEMLSDLLRYSKSLERGIIEQWLSVSLTRNFEEERLKGETYLQKATRKYYKDRPYTNFDVFLILNIPFERVLKSKFSISSFTNRWGKLESDVESIYNKKKTIENSVAILNSSKYFKASPLEEEDLKELIINITTGFNNNFHTDINFNPFQIGDNYWRCFAVNSQKLLPEKITNCKKDIKMTTEKATFYKSFFHSLYIELPHNHIVNMFIFHEGHEEIKEEIEKRQEDFNTWSAWSSGNELGSKSLKSYLNILEENEAIRLCRAHFNVFAWSNSIKDIDLIDTNIFNAFSELDIKAYKPIFDDQVCYFICSIPGNSGFFPKNETFISDLGQSLCFVPYVGNYKEDEFGILLNERLTNKPIYKDFFDKPYLDKIIASRNFGVIAETGRGKSFLTTHMYRAYIEMDFSLVLCDIGHSNETLSKIYKDKVNYVEFKEGQGIGINPFKINSEAELTAEKIENLNNFISIHWKKEAELNEASRVSLNFIIEDYYQNSLEKHSFLNFYRYVKKENFNILRRLDINPEFFNLEEFLHICSEYDKGIYDFLYNGSGEEIQIDDKPAIFFELSNILNNPVILPIMTLMIRDAIDSKIWGASDKKKVLVWEEAAKILKIPGQMKAIDYTAQTVRKYNGSQGLILQSIDNIPDNEIGKAIITNTPLFFVFEHPKGIHSLINRLDLHEHAVDIIKSLRSNLETKTNKYTEFAVLLNNIVNAYRLELPPEAFWAYNADKNQKLELYNELEKTNSIEQAITNILNHEKAHH
jgi:conjugation system TraG family ATPase